MINELRLLIIARRLKKCEVTPLSRPKLREQKVLFNGKPVKVMDYINEVVKHFPKIDVNGKCIDFIAVMRGIYYKHGLKGLNLYVSYIRIRTKVELKKQKKAIKTELIIF